MHLQQYQHISIKESVLIYNLFKISSYKLALYINDKITSTSIHSFVKLSLVYSHVLSP